MEIATPPGECDAGGVELNLLTQLRVQEERGSGCWQSVLGSCCLPVLPTSVQDGGGPGSGPQLGWIPGLGGFSG